MKNVLVASLAWLVACGSGAPHPTPPPPSNAPSADRELEPFDGPIRIGAVLPMTGVSAPFGWMTMAGIKQAIAERNERGGVRGAKLEVVGIDDMGRTADVAFAVKRLVDEEHVVAIIGEATSGATLAGAVVAQERGIPMITPSATNPEITQVGDRIFRACFLDEAQARVMARFAREQLEIAGVAILSDTASAYSVGLATTFGTDFHKRGGTVVLDVHYEGGSAVDPALLAQIKASGADAVYVPGYYTDVATIAIELRKIGVTVPLLGGDGWDSSDLGATAGAAIDGSYYTNHFAIDDPREVTRAFAKRFAADQGGPPDALAALGYDATRVLLDAMERSPSLDGANLAAAMARTKLEGVTGGIEFAGARDPRKQVVVMQFQAQMPRLATALTP